MYLGSKTTIEDFQNAFADLDKREQVKLITHYANDVFDFSITLMDGRTIMIPRSYQYVEGENG